MPARRVVVDGSNIATEGRTAPSLAQLNEAVLAFLNEYPDTEVTVVVDATFGHRIDPSESAEFEEAEANNELVSPPAGAIGRGDAFLLRIAGKIGAVVLSNDSFQEFHGEHDWLFDDSRLIGGKPVPGIGWIFTPRTPVRGVKSRKAVKDAKQKGRGSVPATSSGEVLGPAPTPTKPPPRGRRKDEGARAAQVADAIAVATAESVTGEEDEGGRRRRRKKRGARPAEPVNDSLAFITFIAEHPLGSEVEGEVETFTSHGAFVLAGGARCYVPISALGDPPPRAARDVLTRGGRRRFVVQALDPQRRGIELAVPEFAKVAGAPRPETIEAEITGLPAPASSGPPAGRARAAEATPAPLKRARKATAGASAAPGAAIGSAVGSAPAPARRGRAAAATTPPGAVPDAVAMAETAPVAAGRGSGRKAAGAAGRAAAKTAAPVAGAATAKKAGAAKKAAEPKRSDAKRSDAKKAQAKTSVPKTSAPKASESKSSAPKTAESKTTESKTGESKTGESKTSGSGKSGSGSSAGPKSPAGSRKPAAPAKAGAPAKAAARTGGGAAAEIEAAPVDGTAAGSAGAPGSVGATAAGPARKAAKKPAKQATTTAAPQAAKAAAAPGRKAAASKAPKGERPDLPDVPDAAPAPAAARKNPTRAARKA